MKQLLLSLICIFPFLGFTQKAIFDSLREKIKTEKSDTERVRLLVQLGNKIRYQDTAESWRSQNQIQTLATSLKNDYFQGQAYFLAATIYLANQTIPSIVNYEKAIKIFSSYPNNKRSRLSLGASYINLGLLHNNNNDYETAAHYYLKAEEIYLKDNPTSTDLGILYSNLSIAYGTINKYDEALKYSSKGMDFARKTNDKAMMLNALYAYGGNLVNAKKGDRGLAELDSASVLAQELNDLNMIYSCDFMKAMYYYNTKQYQKAIDKYTLCLEFARKYQFTEGIGNNYLNIAANEAELKKPMLAAAHLDSSAKYLDYSVKSVSKQMYFENYAEVYKQTGNFLKAFAFKDSVAAIKDSLYQSDNIRQIEFRQARFNYDKKQNEVNQLEAEHKLQQLSIRQKKTLNYILIASAGILLTISLLGYRNYKQKQKIQQQRISELEKAKQLLATEAIIKGEEQERSRLAKDLHDGLGGMMSGIKYSLLTMKKNQIMTPENQLAFERSIEMLDSSINEMRRVAHNMMPEALVKFGLDTALNDFCTEVDQSGALHVIYQSIGIKDENFPQTTAITIYRIVQELLNNSMKHASAKNAMVQVSKTNGNISITVEDDGKGFNTAILEASKGIGWTNIQSRVEYLRGKLDVKSEPGKGTSVHIEINV